MQSITTYISERLKISSSKHVDNFEPDSYNELKDIIGDLITKRGKDADLNDIDTSKIKNMSCLFSQYGYNKKEIGNIDISIWDVSNVTDMTWMFDGCSNFNCDLSNWDVSNVKDMSYMFQKCSNFNSDISEWDVSNVKSMNGMFYYCKNFNQDLSKWKLNDEAKDHVNFMFVNRISLKTLPNWYKGHTI